VWSVVGRLCWFVVGIVDRNNRPFVVNRSGRHCACEAWRCGFVLRPPLVGVAVDAQKTRSRSGRALPLRARCTRNMETCGEFEARTGQVVNTARVRDVGVLSRRRELSHARRSLIGSIRRPKWRRNHRLGRTRRRLGSPKYSRRLSLGESSWNCRRRTRLGRCARARRR
jgi:hypothetical protein